MCTPLHCSSSKKCKRERLHTIGRLRREATQALPVKLFWVEMFHVKEKLTFQFAMAEGGRLMSGRSTKSDPLIMAAPAFPFVFSSEVLEAQRAGKPVVALESTIISHGVSREREGRGLRRRNPNAADSTVAAQVCRSPRT